MNKQPDLIANIDEAVATRDDLTGAIETIQYAAQRAILPRGIDEGIYAIQDAEGGIQIVETPGYVADRIREQVAIEAPAPIILHAQQRTDDVESFVLAIAALSDGAEPRYGVGTLEVWADYRSRRLTAIIDGVHGHGRQTVNLEVVMSPELAAWQSIDGKLLPQADLAEFVEDHMGQIADPDASTLLEVTQTLVGTVSAKFASKSTLSNGARTIAWDETVDGKAGDRGTLTIPNDLTLVMPLFYGSDPVAIPARFRFRADRDGGVRVGVRMLGVDQLIQQSFYQVMAAVSEQLPVPVIRGRH